MPDVYLARPWHQQDLQGLLGRVLPSHQEAQLGQARPWDLWTRQHSTGLSSCTKPNPHQAVHLCCCHTAGCAIPVWPVQRMQQTCLLHSSTSRAVLTGLQATQSYLPGQQVQLGLQLLQGNTCNSNLSALSEARLHVTCARIANKQQSTCCAACAHRSTATTLTARSTQLCWEL